MKSNLVIAGCVALLLVLGISLIALTLTPVQTVSTHTMNTVYSWYFKPREDGQQPIVADNASFIDKYRTLYLGNPSDRTIYLTFDIGYENGNTVKILDALKQAGVPAAFFVTGHYIDSNPEIIQRMAGEGHLVCNHTVHHADLSAMTSLDELKPEADGLCEKYEAVTGRPMPKYIRPPEGKYSERALALCDELGYTTVFWSFAYKDWIEGEQPGAQESMDKILSRTHPGMVALFHSTSATNAQIMGDLLAKWKELGYSFGSLDALAAAARTPGATASSGPSA